MGATPSGRGRGAGGAERWMVAALVGALAAASVACGNNALRTASGAGHPVGGDAGAGGAGKLGGDASVDRAIDGLVALLGASCTGSWECASGFCVEGVCCTSACNAACASCVLPGRLGTCSPVPAGSPDPNSVCVDEGAPSCGHDGTCDGQGRCALYAAGVSCAAGSSCAGTIWSGSGTCSGTATCQRETHPCLPYACDPQTNECRSACASTDDCAPGEPCVNGSCGVGEPGSCSADTECASGFCAQGVCCATRCADPCFSCALPGTIGACTRRPGAPDSGACGP